VKNPERSKKMTITATEFKTNISKYLTIVGNEDIFITKNKNSDRASAVQNKIDVAKSLFGIIPDTGVSLEELREERLSRYENSN
jgi:hypothetical protein